MVALSEWVLIVRVCVLATCFHHPPEGGWTSKEACLLPADGIIEAADKRLDDNPNFFDETHYFSWNCVTKEDLQQHNIRLTHHRVLGGKHV